MSVGRESIRRAANAGAGKTVKKPVVSTKEAEKPETISVTEEKKKKAKKENERHYVKRKTAMAGVFAGEALSGMIWAILRELDLTL